jgi:subtilisin family serine protease
VFDHNYNWFDVQGTPWPRPGGVGIDYWHGTHTMGTLVGDDGAGNQIGLAPGAKWMASEGFGELYTYAVSLAALQWIVAPTRLDGTEPDPSMRPDVVDHSWYGKPNGTLNYEKAHDAIRASGIFMANSAGNTGSACATVNSPNNNPGSFNVGATTSTDAIASFSARGPNAFNSGTSPHLTAPGAAVRSSVPGNGYQTWDGTSMAAPHVVGSAALLISLEPKLRGQVAQMRELLRRTADGKTSTQTCGGVPGSQVPNNTFGWGRVNVKAAADMIHDAGWLSGTVTSGGVPVYGALVTFAKDVYTYTLTTRTDAAGRYRVLAGAGTWNMTA